MWVQNEWMLTLSAAGEVERMIDPAGGQKTVSVD